MFARIGKPNSLVCETTDAVRSELCVQAFNELNPRTHVRMDSLTDQSLEEGLTCRKMSITLTGLPDENLDVFPCRITVPATENEEAIDITFFLTQGDIPQSVIIILYDLRYEKYFVFYKMILDEEDTELLGKLIHQKMKKPAIQPDSHFRTQGQIVPSRKKVTT